MKVNAFILLTTFLLFISQTIQIPSKCDEIKYNTEGSSCPMKAMHKKCMNEKQQMPNQQNSHKSKCIDCPFFSVLISPSVTRIENFLPLIKSKIAFPIKSNLSDYAPKLWKPPDAFFLL
jgi:hypothetical protein